MKHSIYKLTILIGIGMLFTSCGSYSTNKGAWYEYPKKVKGKKKFVPRPYRIDRW